MRRFPLALFCCAVAVLLVSCRGASVVVVAVLVLSCCLPLALPCRLAALLCCCVAVLLCCCGAVLLWCCCLLPACRVVLVGWWGVGVWRFLQVWVSGERSGR
ncbi:hypothetical protein F7Q99_39700 [Streptomyces kaniharaensis]|uniref:Uncharacterized protein n=1 Tax=Streptomyces kaniharaensis TaxID=212423 RepID=A0A6N7L5S2_9ACTN|nr:hypothetical protein [Streptomyces kaniharaensis]MQS18148.1 hypothetical protein [Streptomyces kaniharaensis]